MNSTFFCNRKSLQINSPKIRADIKTLINNIGYFNLASKYYTFLNKKNVNNLKDDKFLVSLSTFGKKFVLFVTRYESKKYCIFINKKNDSMIVTQLKFTDDIFNGTLFDGELVKNSNDKWIFLINDIAYCKGENIITKSFNERQLIIENILQSEYDYKEDNQTFFLSKKNYFKYEHIQDLVDNYMPLLNYKCSGIYFKNISNFSDNYLFIFPECRSDSKILNNGVTIDKKEVILKNDINNEEDIEDEELFGKIEKINEPENKNVGNDVGNDIGNCGGGTNRKLEKTTCNFLLQPTIMPDVYELYCKTMNNKIEKHSYASVPDLDTSEFLKNIDQNMDDIHSKIEKNTAVFVECNYHKVFKKWVPFKKTSTFDNIATINQIQIILDSL
jgi:hypothetical protein